MELKDLVYIPKDYFPRVESTQLRRHDILIVKDGSNTGDVALAWSDDERIVTNEHLFTLRVDGGQNGPFAFYFLQSHEGWKQLKGVITGSAQPGLAKSFIDKVEIPVPPLDEQRKIASVLLTVDRAIQTTEAIIAQAKRVKRGLKQTLFAEGAYGHSEFVETKSGQYPADWDLVRFEDLISDTRYGTDTKSNTDGEGYPTLRIPNIVNRRIILDDLKYTPLSESEIDRLRLKDGDLLVIRTNGNPNYVGRCATFSEKEDDYAYASYLIRVRVNESRVRPAFVREFLNSYRGRAEMSGWIRSSAGNYNLSVGAMEKFQIPLPSLDEQDAIVQQLRNAEQAISVNRINRDRVKRLKKGLMQDLLTGRVRTAGTNIDILDEVQAHG